MIRRREHKSRRYASETTAYDSDLDGAFGACHTNEGSGRKCASIVFEEDGKMLGGGVTPTFIRFYVFALTNVIHFFLQAQSNESEFGGQVHRHLLANVTGLYGGIASSVMSRLCHDN
jgi:hypothetical protein